MREIADYRLEEQMGQGNHGRFFLAVPPARLEVDAEWVAIKLLDGRASEDEFRRFENELRLFASVQSPYLVEMLDAGQYQGALFYVTPHYPLGSLATPARPLDTADVVQAVADAARGAHALHEVGVAHRDIKPANVLLVDGGGRLTDLGLAQVLNPGQTVTGRGPIGAIEFMEPGVVRGEKASRASDIWALGATLHKALTGMSVFGEIPTSDVLSALRHILATSPQVDPGVPEGLAEVIGRCVAPAPQDRPSTAEQLAEELEAIIKAGTTS